MSTDEQFMKKAIEVALQARQKGNEPFGAVLVKNGEIVMIGENRIHTFNDPTHHAEIAGGNIMIASKEVFEKSPQRPELTEKILNEEGLRVFEGYSFSS